MIHLVTLALLGLVAALPARAESSAASSASDSLATSVGSSSTSIQKSSNSSSNDKVAAGEYRVIEMAAAGPGQLRLRLQPLGAGAEFALLLPQKTAEQHALAVGQVVNVREREYGLEFATHEDRQAFYLVLADEWYRDLQTRAVTL
jgi:hypothetical protein